MRLEEMMAQCGAWHISCPWDCEELIVASVGGYAGKGKTIEFAIVNALNTFAERERAKYPWVARLEVDHGVTGSRHWWAASSGGGISADTIAEACEAVKPKPVTLGVIGEHPAAVTTTKVYVNGKPVVGFEVVEGWIELKTEA